MQWNSKYNHEVKERGLDNESQLQGFKSSPNPWRKLMIPPGFQFLTEMIVTVSADSGVLVILNNGVLDYLEFLWQATAEKEQRDPNIHVWDFVDTVTHMKQRHGSYRSFSSFTILESLFSSCMGDVTPSWGSEWCQASLQSTLSETEFVALSWHKEA